MAKKKAKSAPKKTVKKAVKKQARRATSSSDKGTPRKKAAARKSTSKKTFAELAGRFIGSQKKAGAKQSMPPRVADAQDLRDDADAIVAAAMPGVKIVHLSKQRSADAAQVATMQGASLNDLQRKYIGRNRSQDSSANSAVPAVRSQVVFVQQDDETSDQPMGPKAVIVRDGKVRGYQG
jgi:hypothetical protein